MCGGISTVDIHIYIELELLGEMFVLSILTDQICVMVFELPTHIACMTIRGKGIIHNH